MSDFTYVATWAGFVYLAFVTDTYARRIVGWRAVGARMPVLDALEQALHDRRPMRGGGIVHHSDRSSQYMSIKYTDRRRPWRSFEAVEYATLEWVAWFNHRRLLEPLGNIPPAKAGEQYYAAEDIINMAA